MATKPLPDQATLLKLLRYEPETGKLFWKPRDLSDGFKHMRSWKVWMARYANKEAFTSDNGLGYRGGSLFGRGFKAHRIIWKMVTGSEAEDIDHVNGDRSDNRLCNLRSVPRLLNTQNASLYKSNTSGCPGVVFRKRDCRWTAKITVNGTRLQIGTFASKGDAVRARKQAEREFGFHPNHGRSK